MFVGIFFQQIKVKLINVVDDINIFMLQHV